MSDRNDAELERALKTLGRTMPAPAGAGLLDRVEAELTSREDAGTHRSWRPLAVAAVAFAIAGIGAVLVWRAFGAPSNLLGSDPTPPPGPTNPPRQYEYGPVWPELEHYVAARIQERADDGDPQVQWRLDPTEVARRAVAESLLNWRVGSVELVEVHDDGTRLYEVDAEGEGHRVAVRQVVRKGEDGIWNAVSVVSRLELDHIRIETDGTTSFWGHGAPAGAQIGYRLHRACPRSYDGTCGYTLELRSVRAGADGTFRVEDEFRGWLDQPAVIAVWVIEERPEATRFGPITMVWVPPGEYSTG